MSNKKNKRKTLFIIITFVALALLIWLFLFLKNRTTGEDIMGTTWIWERTDFPNGAMIKAPGGDAFVISFGSDGRMTSTTDCNGIFGNFETSGNDIEMGDIAATKIYCGPATFEQEYTRQLSRVSTFSVSGGKLHFNLAENTGIMVFTNRN